MRKYFTCSVRNYQDQVYSLDILISSIHNNLAYILIQKLNLISSLYICGHINDFCVGGYNTIDPHTISYGPKNY